MMLQRHHRSSILSIVLVLFAVIVLVCAQDNHDAPLTETDINDSAIQPKPPSNPAAVDRQSILSLLEANDGGAMAELLRTSEHLTDVREVLGGPGGFTFFAPNNRAMSDHASLLKNRSVDYHTWLRYLLLLKPMTVEDMTTGHTKILNTSLTGTHEHLLPKKGSTKDYVLAVEKRDKYHMVWSSFPQSAAKVVKRNIRASNGVLHIIDKVVEPPMTAEWTMQNTPDLSQFSKVLHSLNMSTKWLHGETIFAPSNAAMKDLPSELWSPARQALAMQFHIMHGAFYTDNLNTGKLVNSKTGATLVVNKQSDDNITISGAKILVKDILTDNGRNHTM